MTASPSASGPGWRRGAARPNRRWARGVRAWGRGYPWGWGRPSRPTRRAARRRRRRCSPAPCEWGSRLVGAAADQDVALGQVHLEAPDRQPHELQPAVEGSRLADEPHRAAVGPPERRRRRPRRCTPRPGAAPVRGSTSPCTIELNCLPRRVATVNAPGGSGGASGTSGVNRGPGRRASGSAAGAQVAAAPLHLVARAWPASRCRRRAGRPPAISARSAWLVGHEKRRREIGADPLGDVGEQAPLAAGLADLAGQLGAEHDAALGGGLGAAALLLVAGGHRQQDHVVARRRASGEVSTTSWCTRSGHPPEGGLARAAGSGRTSRKLPPDAPEHVEVARARRPRSSRAR